MKMLEFETTAQFRKDYKRIEKRQYDLSLMDEVVQTLLERIGTLTAAQMNLISSQLAVQENIP
jgi:mRNA-degrading endonuclease YafQ of YafQ-DinJ toxin-antitoxin module